MTHEQSTAELFASEHTRMDDFDLLTASIVAQYDIFERECMERSFTPTYELFSLWLDAINHNAKTHRFISYSLMRIH
jgi:hypothetical protein